MNYELIELACFWSWLMFWFAVCFCVCCLGVSFVIHSAIESKKQTKGGR